MNAWVVFHGAGARTIDALADYDAFVVLGQDQGSPNALLEALAAGLPCIANDDGGTREQIQHEHTGLLVADRSSSTLAAAITSVLVDRGLAARIGAAGRAHVLRSFSLERMVSRYAQLFESCRGVGGDAGENRMKCPRCHGRGTIARRFWFITWESPCPRCGVRSDDDFRTRTDDSVLVIRGCGRQPR